MRNLLFPAALVALVASCTETPRPELHIDAWTSEAGTVCLDFLDGQDASCDSIHVWLDSIRTSFEEEDPQISCKAEVVYQNPNYVTYLHEVHTLPSDYYEGDNSSRCLTFSRATGRVVTVSDLCQNIDSLSQLVLQHTRLENSWAIDAMGGDSTLLSLTSDLTVGVTARGYTFSYPVMEGLWQILCTVPSGEMLKQ